jgi:hypothetical protein
VSQRFARGASRSRSRQRMARREATFEVETGRPKDALDVTMR